MKPFRYISPESIEEACSVFAEYGSDARVLAGGTDLLIELRRENGRMPKVVVDISRITELIGISEVNGSVALKPLATHTQLEKSQFLNRFAPLLASASSMIGSPQIRNLGTVGGNVMNAAACADTVPPLIALNASATLTSKRGSRRLDLGDLFVKPYETQRRADEILTEIRFPKLSSNARSAFIKLGRRNALSISRLSVATILELDEARKIINARIVPGSAFPTWKRVTEAERMILGETPSTELFAAAGDQVSRSMIEVTGRRWSTEYKEPVIAVLVRRALEMCSLQPAFVT